jgi:nickel/cobalt transporter (NicO) family protein
MMHWLIETQRWLYGGMWDGMKAVTDVSALPAFLGTAFVFGMVHALMPGHGKSVLVSYHLGRPSRLVEGVSTGTILALTHVGLAVVLVMAGVAVISKAFAYGGRAPPFEVASAALISCIGLYLLIRTIWPPPHAHDRDGRALAMVTGMVPCPLTTFILSYAFALNKLVTGFAAVGAMLVGVIVTLVTFAVGAVIARDRLTNVLKRTEWMWDTLGYWLELAGAAAVLVLGLVMLWGQIGRLWTS